jgi:hypothetical protein
VSILEENHSKVDDCPTGPGETFPERRDALLEALEDFDAAPFTVQRLCELLTGSAAAYRSTHKLLSAVDRVVSVTSTLPVTRPGDEAASDERVLAEAAGAMDAVDFVEVAPPSGNLPRVEMGDSAVVDDTAITPPPPPAKKAGGSPLK